ncbi:MAG: acyl-CoA dehydrogenase family protein [Pseudomonadota bacterium]
MTQSASDRADAAELASFRAEVAAFVDETMAGRARPAMTGLLGAEREAMAWWQAALHAKGWGAPNWPTEYGGAGWSAAQLGVLMEESARVEAPMISPFGVVMVGPVIYSFGSAAQKARHLPGILSGEIFWCQGYSEPGAGSDLASLKTRAIRDGDDYVVNGQKIWTTHAHFADWMFCLVRTDPEAKPQKGISFLLIDMKSPGVEVRAIDSIDGMHHLNEVFFTDVRVPAENLVGVENEGWTYAKFLLVNERAGIANVAGTRRDLAKAKAYAASGEAFVAPPLGDPTIAAAFDALEDRLEALDALEERALAAPTQSPEAMRLTAPLKLLGSELAQDVSELAVRVAGPAALRRPVAAGEVSPYGVYGQTAMSSFLFGRSHSIYGGTSEVQKNIMAKLLMGGL